MTAAIAQTTTTTDGTIGSSSTLRHAMISEWRKISTIRSPWIVTGIVTLLAAAVSGLATFFGQRAINDGVAADEEVLLGAISGLPIASYLGVIAIVIVGALIGSGDFQHQTVVPTLLQQPKRWKFLAAKIGFTVAASSALALVLVAVTMAAAFVVSPEIGEFRPFFAEGTNPDSVEALGLFELLPIVIGHLTLAGLFGMALGWATRSTAFAVSGFFVLRFVELTVAGLGFVSHWASNLLPFRAGDRLLPYVVNDADPGRLGSTTASAGVYISVIAVLALVGVVRTYRQDID